MNEQTKMEAIKDTDTKDKLVELIDQMQGVSRSVQDRAMRMSLLASKLADTYETIKVALDSGGIDDER